MDRQMRLYGVLLYQIYFVSPIKGVFYSCNTTDLKEICFGQVGSDQVIFSYQLTREIKEGYLTLKCEAKGYPRYVAIKDPDTKVAEKAFSKRNYLPTIVLKMEPMNFLCLLVKSYTCEVTDFEGNNRTYTLRVVHPKCSPRLLDVTKNNSVVYANVNNTAVFTLSVISAGNVTVNTDTNNTQVNITECQIDNCLIVSLSLIIEQESDFKSYIAIIKRAENATQAIEIMYSIKLKDLPQFCSNTSNYYTNFTRTIENLSVNFCLKSGVDIQHQHKMEVYVDNQRLSDKDIQVTKHNSSYLYGLGIFLHNITFDRNISVKIKVLVLELRLNLTIVMISNNTTIRPSGSYDSSTLVSTDTTRNVSATSNISSEIPTTESLETHRKDILKYIIIGTVAVATFGILIVILVKHRKVKIFLRSKLSSIRCQPAFDNDNSNQVIDEIKVEETKQTSTSRNSKGLNYITVDHTSLRDSLSTNRSSHSQDHVVYARLDFQKMAREGTIMSLDGFIDN